MTIDDVVRESVQALASSESLLREALELERDAARTREALSTPGRGESEMAWPVTCTLWVHPERGRPDASRSSVLIDLEHKPELNPLQPYRVSTFVAAVRATGPFVLEPVLEIALDIAHVGVQYFGCVDRLTRPHAPFLLTRTRTAWLLMIRYFAKSGLAPWNRDEEAMGRLGCLQGEDAPLRAPTFPAQVPEPAADRKG